MRQLLIRKSPIRPISAWPNRSNTFEKLTCLTTDEGKEHLNSKDEDTISASASLITNLLHFVEEAWHSPLQVLQAAVLGYSTQRAEDDEFRIVYEFLEEMQDVTDEVIGLEAALSS